MKISQRAWQVAFQVTTVILYLFLILTIYLATKPRGLMDYDPYGEVALIIGIFGFVPSLVWIIICYWLAFRKVWFRRIFSVVSAITIVSIILYNLEISPPFDTFVHQGAMTNLAVGLKSLVAPPGGFPYASYDDVDPDGDIITYRWPAFPEHIVCALGVAVLLLGLAATDGLLSIILRKKNDLSISRAHQIPTPSGS